MKANKTNKIRIELNSDELDTIYTALNRLCCHYSDKSVTMKKIKDGTATVDDHLNPDYYFVLWHEVGELQSRIYEAKERICK